MRIGELARRSGASPRALRYYEEQGLLRPERRPSGYREYAESDVRTVRHVRTLLDAGLGTAVIAEVLPCMVASGAVLAPACPELLPALAVEHERITRTVDQLLAARTMLEAVMAASPDRAVPPSGAWSGTRSGTRSGAGDAEPVPA